MHKRGTIDLDNETVTAERLLNARGSFRQTSVLSRADSTMKLKTQTQDAKVRFCLATRSGSSTALQTESGEWGEECGWTATTKSTADRAQYRRRRGRFSCVVCLRRWTIDWTRLSVCPVCSRVSRVCRCRVPCPQAPEGLSIVMSVSTATDYPSDRKVGNLLPACD